MSEPPPLQRGDIVLLDFPFVSDQRASKLRPAVIVQNNIGNRFSPNLIVAAITSQLPRREYPTNLVIRAGTPDAAGTGLDRSSALQAEVILTVPKASVTRRLGRLSERTMRAFDQCLKVSLGLQ